MGAVICDASFHAQRHYDTMLKPRLLRLQAAWPDAATVTGFQARIQAEDLTVAMAINDRRRAATAHGITAVLTAEGVDTREDLNGWLQEPQNRARLRAVHGVGAKTMDYIANLVGGSAVAIDVHLKTFAAQAGLTDLRYEPLRAAYLDAAQALGQDPAAMEHAVWRHQAKA